MYQQKKLCHRKSVFTVYVLLDKKEVFIIQVSQGLLGTAIHKLMIGIIQLMYSNFLLLNNFIGTSNICNQNQETYMQ